MQELRAEFPVLERVAYLNAGTNGPVPARAAAAAQEEMRVQLEDGRASHAWIVENCVNRGETLRARVAALMGCSVDELAFVTSTTGGVNTVLPALGLGPGDEVLTSDEEHPGVLAPLAVGRARAGFDVRVVPFDEVAGEVGPRTKLVATSHVSWVSGRVADTAALAGTDALVLLDGAQGLGAVPVDVREFGCDFYAASGQKWPCGPNGLGYLYVRAEHVGELLPAAPGFGSVVEPDRPLESELEPTARRYDAFLPAPQQSAWALAALDVLEAPGIDRVHQHAAELAAALAERLVAAGRTVAPRGRSTLVSWHSKDPEAEARRLAAEGIVVRWIPRVGLVRASVGGWTSEEDVERLVAGGAQPDAGRRAPTD